MGPYQREQMLLSASLDCLCGRRWEAFEGARLLIQAPRYSPLQDSFSTRPNSRALVTVLLTPWHRPRCPKCHRPHTPCCRQLQTWNLAAYHLFALSLWYPVLAGIRKRRYESFISWEIRACKLVCLPSVTLEKDQWTWLPSCNSA